MSSVCLSLICVLCRYLYTSGGKFYSDGGLGLEVELVPCESGQQVGLANAGISDQHNWKWFGNNSMYDLWLISKGSVGNYAHGRRIYTSKIFTCHFWEWELVYETIEDKLAKTVYKCSKKIVKGSYPGKTFFNIKL